MAAPQDIAQLPYRLTDWSPDTLPLLQRCLNTLQSNIAVLQGYIKTAGGGSTVAAVVQQAQNVWNLASNINADGTFDATKLQGVIETIQIADAAVTAAKVAVDAITTVNIADNAITDTKIAAGVVSEDKTNWASHLLF